MKEKTRDELIMKTIISCSPGEIQTCSSSVQRKCPHSTKGRHCDVT